MLINLSVKKWAVVLAYQVAEKLSSVIPGRAEREPGISRFRVWSSGPSRNDDHLKIAAAIPLRYR
jgi:hypothetical protein